MKYIVWSAALTLTLCASVQASSVEASNSKTTPSLKQYRDGKGALVTQAGFAEHNVTTTTTPDPKFLRQSPYSQAQIVVSKQINGVEHVVGSKIVSVTDASPATYSDTVDYIGECVATETKNDSTCTTKSAPVGMLAQVYYSGSNKGVPVYKVNVGWRELTRMPSYSTQENGRSIDLPEISERSFVQTVTYTKPLEFAGFDVKDGEKTNDVIVRVTLM